MQLHCSVIKNKEVKKDGKMEPLSLLHLFQPPSSIIGIKLSVMSALPPSLPSFLPFVFLNSKKRELPRPTLRSQHLCPDSVLGRPMEKVGAGFRVRGSACNLNLMIKPPVALVNGLVTGAGKWPSAMVKKLGGHAGAGESRDVRWVSACWAVA